MSTPEILEEYFSEYTTIELLQYKEQYEDILPLKTEWSEKYKLQTNIMVIDRILCKRQKEISNYKIKH